IGMKTTPKAEDMWEFSVFPKIILVMIILGVIIGILGMMKKVSYWWFLGWFIFMSILGVLGMYDFNVCLVEYGRDLDPNAIMKHTNPDGTPISYKPPLIGYKKLLNFDVASVPHIGGYMMFAGMMLTLVAFFVGRMLSNNK